MRHFSGSWSSYSRGVRCLTPQPAGRRHLRLARGSPVSSTATRSCSQTASESGSSRSTRPRSEQASASRARRGASSGRCFRRARRSRSSPILDSTESTATAASSGMSSATAAMSISSWCVEAPRLSGSTTATAGGTPRSSSPSRRRREGRASVFGGPARARCGTPSLPRAPGLGPPPGRRSAADRRHRALRSLVPDGVYPSTAARSRLPRRHLPQLSRQTARSAPLRRRGRRLRLRELLEDTAHLPGL